MSTALHTIVWVDPGSATAELLGQPDGCFLFSAHSAADRWMVQTIHSTIDEALELIFQYCTKPSLRSIDHPINRPRFPHLFPPTDKEGPKDEQ